MARSSRKTTITRAEPQRHRSVAASAAKKNHQRWARNAFLAAALVFVASLLLASLDSILVAAVPLAAAAADNDETSMATAPRSSNSSNAFADDCADKPSFRYRRRGCDWVGKKTRRKTKKRCEMLKKGKPIAERCRKTCDYGGCASRNKLMVGAYYYPWWGDNFHRRNPEDPDNYLRSQLTGPQQFPLLGEYDDQKPEIIARHLRWSRGHNIGLWVTSWWGKDRQEDKTTKDHILTHPRLGDHKIAVFYETTGRIKERDGYSLENVRPDIEYICQQYFDHPNYYKLESYPTGDYADDQPAIPRPVLFVYLTRKLEDLGLLEEVVSLMRESAADAGCADPFIVGDQVFRGPPKANHDGTVDDADLVPFEVLDGVTNYDVYGSMRGGHGDGYIGSKEKVEEYYSEQTSWKDLAARNNCSFVPGVSPGFNDRGVRPDKERIPLSRRLSPGAHEGSLFEAALREARKLADPRAGNLLMVNSFNEWHEDTQIEPCVGVGGSKESTNLPVNLTHGLHYEGYGTKYLKILKRETKNWEVPVVAAAAEATTTTTTTTTEELWTPTNGNLGDGVSDDIVTISDTMGWELE